MVLKQFQDLVTEHYNMLKDFPEFNEAQEIYLELYEVRKTLSELEAERLQYYNNLNQQGLK